MVHNIQVRNFESSLVNGDHVTSSPYYPQSNGLAGRAVRSAEGLLQKCKDGIDINLALLNQRNTPRDEVRTK